MIGLLLLTLTVNSYAQDPNFYIYLCFGQSNMEGQGTIETQDRTVDSRFQVFQALTCSNLGRTKGIWYPALPPLCQCWSKLCPADYFGRSMVENLPDSITIGVINVSVGGCDIRLFDKDVYQDYDSTYTESWFLDKIAWYEGNPYQYLIDLALLAQQDGVIKGILLHQGETNTGDSQWPSYVEKIYEDMLDDLSLDADEVPLLAGEVLSVDGACCASMNTIIDKLPETIPTAYVISSDGCTGQDEAHFDSEGYRELGSRYAAQMLLLPGYETGIFNINGERSPNSFALSQNYPNPFNPETTIKYNLYKSSNVTLKIYNNSGQELETVINGFQTAGDHEISLQAKGLPSGIYFYRIQAGEFSETKKFIIKK